MDTIFLILHTTRTPCVTACMCKPLGGFASGRIGRPSPAPSRSPNDAPASPRCVGGWPCTGLGTACAAWGGIVMRGGGGLPLVHVCPGEGGGVVQRGVVDGVGKWHEPESGPINDVALKCPVSGGLPRTVQAN